MTSSGNEPEMQKSTLETTMKHILVASLALAAGAANATYCSLESPQYCPKPTTPAATPSTQSLTATLGQGQGQEQGQGQSQSSAAGASAGAAAGASAGSTSSGGSSSSSNSNDTNARTYLFPAPVAAATLPAIRCRSTSRAGGLGWNFISGAGSDSDADGICQASDLAAALLANCQQKSAYQVLYPVLNKAYKGLDLVVPADAVNAPGGVCPKPPVVPAPTPTPEPEKKFVPAPAPERFTLSAGALFDSAKYQLKATAELDALADKLVAAKPERVVVIGHTDNTRYDNQTLSLNRANAVRTYLVLRGVDPRVIVADGRADREPVASNSTREGRAANRRVVVEVTATK